MEIVFKYKVTEADALARLHALGEYFGNKHGIKVTWDGDKKASFDGKYLVVRIEGDLTLEPGVVHFKGKDPGSLWRKKASSYIEEKLAMYLDPATPLDQLPRGP